MFYLTIIQYKKDCVKKQDFEDFEDLLDAIEATGRYNSADEFEIHSGEKWMPHLLSGKKQDNGYIDWVSKMDHL